MNIPDKARVSPSYDNHEMVSFIDDQKSGLKAIIAIHNTNLGPAVGGCRMFPYADEAQALEDVLRLSRGMTYKSALAGLPMGGGKAVMIGDPATDKTPELMRRMGAFIDTLEGNYISAEDSGTNVADLKEMGTQTQHVLGVSEEQEFGGDPSPLTALGIFVGIGAAVQHKLGHQTLRGRRVAVQGAGSVGQYLIKLLIEDGAEVFACDINHRNLAKAEMLGAQIIGLDEVISYDADVFAPCAMGGILNDESIRNLAAPIVAGGANNQLAQDRHASMLMKNRVLYAPDYVINAGGIIEVCRQYQNSSLRGSRAQIEKIGATLSHIFELSDSQSKPTSLIADEMAYSLFNKPVLMNKTLGDAA